MTIAQTINIYTNEVDDSPLREFVGYNMKLAFNAIQADLNATLAQVDLRMLTFSALALIVAYPDLRQSQLAQALSIERPNLVQIIDELERRAAITRTPDPNDRRATALRATPSGQQLFDRANTLVQEHDARMTEHLARGGRHHLIKALQMIEANSLPPSQGGMSK